MFADDDDSGKSAAAAGFRNLVGIEISRIEERGIIIAVAPFFSGESVETQVHQRIAAVFP